MQIQCAWSSALVVEQTQSSLLLLVSAWCLPPVMRSQHCPARVCGFPERSDNHRGKTISEPCQTTNIYLIYKPITVVKRREKPSPTSLYLGQRDWIRFQNYN